MAAADAARRAATSLRLTGGKCVVELRPCLDWGKGNAVRWLGERAVPQDAKRLYLGDDETDEDAFRTMPSLGGIGIQVGSGPLLTYATYRLASPAAVEQFLRALLARLGSGTRSDAAANALSTGRARAC